MTKPTATLCFFLLLLPLPATLSAQSLPAGFRQFTSNDGLPSSEVYEILQDRQGYLWFGTDNGVSRFNGYEFENFGALQGLNDPTVFYLQEDRQGKIWMQCMSGRLYYFEKDSIHDFAGNLALDSLKERIKIYGNFYFYVDSLGQVFNSLQSIGLMRFSPVGEGTFLIKDLFSISVFVVENKTINVRCRDIYRKDLASALGKSLEEKNQWQLTLFLGSQKFQHALPRGEKDGHMDSWLFEDKMLLVNGYGYLYCFREGKLVWQILFPQPITAWHQNPKGEIYLGLGNRQGVRRYRTFADLRLNRFDAFLEGFTVAGILEDRQGGYWFATNEAGVFYQSNPGAEIFNSASGFPSNYVNSIALKNENEAFVGLESGDVVTVDARSKKTIPLPHVGIKNEDLAFDASQDILWGMGDAFTLHYFKQGKWHLMLDSVASAKQKKQVRYYARHFHFSSDRKVLWTTFHGGFFRINPSLQTVDFTNRDLVGQKTDYSIRTLDAYTTSTNRTWIANVNGLFELKDNQLFPPEKQHPAFQNRIEAIEELPDGTLVLGSKGYGLIFWKGDQIASLTVADGLTANMIENLHVDASGNLWAGTLNGLNKIRWSWSDRPVRISSADRSWFADLEILTTAHGLPSNEITDLATWGKTVWVATTKGLSRFSARKRNPVSPKPILKSVLADRRPLDPTNAGRLSFWENNLSIHYFAINFKMNGRIPYRFRLDGGEWSQTFNTSLNFPSLPPGERLFEVQAQNEDGVWSEPTAFRFNIRPPWWETWWAIGSGFCLMGLLALAAYKFRTRQLKQQIATERQLAELERKALQAQMNPHFIFNCLNSIQNYIVRNENQAAAIYLSRFAKLVRSTLNASVAGKISLSEEMDLLENYLSLEKLRLGDRFDFEVKIDPETDPDDVRLPPMLVQPFVENAVLHGIRGRTTGGRISIFFKENAGYLEVAVQDNGNGFSAAQNPVSTLSADRMEASTHKPVGMSITRRRMQLLEKSARTDLVQMEETKDAAGKVTGTLVRLKIRIED